MYEAGWDAVAEQKVNEIVAQVGHPGPTDILAFLRRWVR